MCLGPFTTRFNRGIQLSLISCASELLGEFGVAFKSSRTEHKHCNLFQVILRHSGYSVEQGKTD